MDKQRACDGLSDSFQAAFQPGPFEDLAKQVIRMLTDHLKDIQAGGIDSVIPYKPADELAQEFDASDFSNSPVELFEHVLSRCIRLHHPRYLGHQISPVAPVAAIAGLLVDFVNNGMGVYEMGMAGTILERKVIQRVSRALGFSGQADGYMTSGGSLANLTALLAARRHAAPESWTTRQTGKMAVMVSDQSHYCIDRAARIMGWGDEGIIKVPTNDKMQMQCDELDRMHDQACNDDVQVVAVIGSACSTATGSFDDLNAIADFCEQRNIWFHVDGAHGAATAFSDKYRHLVNGIHRADSVTLDFHKMLLVPATASALIFKNSSTSYRTFQLEADYLFDRVDEPEWFNLARRTFECTKSMMSLKVFSVLGVYGESIWNENVTRLYDIARAFADQVQVRDSLELLVVPESNIVCFRCRTENLSIDEENDMNASIRSQICQEGKFYIVQTRIDDTLWLRATVANAFTLESDITELLKDLEKKCRELHKRSF